MYEYDKILCTIEDNVEYFYKNNNTKIKIDNCNSTYSYIVDNTITPK